MPQTSMVELPGLRLHAESCAGPGPAVLLVHGYASSGRMWRSALERLDGQAAAHALDLPGHGHSDQPHYSWYSLDSFVGALRGYARAAGLERAALVGHSMGGTIALEYTRRFPAAVERLVLVNPVITGRLYLDLPWLARRLPGRWVLSVTRRLWPGASARLLRRIAARRARRGPIGYLERNQEDLARMSADALIGCARAVARANLASGLGDVAVPTLVVVGRRDATVPPREGRLAARAIPGARLAELAAGHLPLDETPAEALDLLAGFLLEHPIRPASAL